MNFNNQCDLGLYVHIPFCVKKCDYCDFLSAPATDEIQKAYFDALITEIESYGCHLKDYIIPTIFFGGGTPSCADEEDIRRVMQTIHRNFHLDINRFEATIEVNPGTVTRDKLRIYKEAGFNRLSFGLQSADNKELKLLGRIHTYEQFEKNYQMAREEGFTNINIDLMSALPGQTLQSWESTLNAVIALKPEHISAYSLIIEEGTKFYERYRKGAENYAQLPDEETDRLIYHRTKQILQEHNYERYEISNYAKRGYESAHNSSYWIGTDYLGIGIGASTLLNGARYSNLQSIEHYIRLCKEFKRNNHCDKVTNLYSDKEEGTPYNPIGLIQDFEKLNMQQKMEEFMFLGLRMCSGISKNAFFKRFNVDIDLIYNSVFQELIKKNLLIINGDIIQLTDYGIDVSNSVLSVFLLN